MISNIVWICDQVNIIEAYIVIMNLILDMNKQEKIDYMNCREKDGCMLSMMLRRTSGSGNRFVESNMLQSPEER